MEHRQHATRPPSFARNLASAGRLRLAGASIALSLLCLGLGAASASAAGLPPQGLYEWCAPYQPQPQCAGRLSQAGAAGFQLVLNYGAWYGDAAQVQAYASEAQAAGVKLIWPLTDASWRDPGSATSLLSTYSTLAQTCGCSNNSGFIRYAIGLTRSLPVTWGYYIGDELPASQASAAATLATAVRAIDPGHPLLYVGVGMNQSNLASNLQPFAPLANYVGADDYPIGNDGSSITDVAPTSSAVGQLSQQDHTLPVMVLQAFDWSQYPGTQTGTTSWPTEAQMQTMRDEALNANPSMILWYSLEDIERSDNPAGHWQDLIHAAFAPIPPQPGSTATPTPPKTTTTATPVTTTTHSTRARARARARRRARMLRARLASLTAARDHARRHHRRTSLEAARDRARRRQPRTHHG